jgi:hypothetical protein
MALASGMYSAAAAAVEAQKRHKRRRHIDIETLRASRSRSTPGERARAQEIRRVTSPTRHRVEAALRGASVRDALREAERARITGDFSRVESFNRAAGLPSHQFELGKRAIGQILESLYYTPAGLYQTEEAVRKDVGAAAGGDLSFRRSRALGGEMAHQVAEDFRHPLRNIGYLGMDLTALASAGAGTAARVSGAGRAIARGEAGVAARNLVRPDIPRRSFRVGDLDVEGSYSNSALARYAQRAADKLRERGTPVGGLRRRQESKAGYELGENLRVQDAIERAPAIAVQRTGRRLTAPQQTALRVVAEGQPIAERIRFHQAQAHIAENTAERSFHIMQVGLLRRARRYVDDSGPEPVLSAKAGRKLRRAQELVEQNAGKREEILTQLERLSPDQIEGRISAPGRVIETGAPVTAASSRQLSLLEQGGDFAGGRTRIPYERGIPGFSVPTFVRGVRGSFGGLRKGQAVGFPRELSTTRQPFTGRLLLSGRFRSDVTNLVAEDHLKAQRLGAVLRGREALEAAAKDVPDDPRTAVPLRTEELRNRPLPRAVRDAIEAAENADLTRENVRALVDRDLEKLRQDVFPDLTFEEFLEAKRIGDPNVEGIKWVDADLLDHSGLNAPPTVLAAATRTAKGARGALTLFDVINDASRIAILYLKPAYLAPNVLGNAAMTLVHQGPFAVPNLAKSARLSAHLGDEGTALVDSVMQEGLAAALNTQKVTAKVSGRLADIWGKAVDVPFRRAAFLHEARRRGYRKLRDVRRLLEDPARRGELIQIARRANREIIDYSRLGPLERSVIRRIVFFYPWVKGSTIYGVRFPFEHPVQAAAAVQLGREGEAQAEEDLGDLPGFMRGTFQVGERDGQPLVVNPRSISVLQTPLDLVDTAAGFIEGDERGREALGNLTPPLSAAVTAFTGKDALGNDVQPGAETFGKQLYEGLPQVRLAEKLGMSEEERAEKLYPETPADALGQFLGGATVPRPLNLERARDMGREERLARMSPARRARQHVLEERNKAWMEAQRIGLLPPGQKFGKSIRDAYNLKARRKSAYAKAGVGKLEHRAYQLAALTVDVKLAVQIGALTQAKGAQALRLAQTKTEAELSAWREMFTEQAFGGALLAGVRAAIKEAGGDL